MNQPNPYANAKAGDVIEDSRPLESWECVAPATCPACGSTDIADTYGQGWLCHRCTLRWREEYRMLRRVVVNAHAIVPDRNPKPEDVHPVSVNVKANGVNQWVPFLTYDDVAEVFDQVARSQRGHQGTTVLRQLAAAFRVQGKRKQRTEGADQA